MPGTSATLGELLAKNGVAVFGRPDALCPHCGAAPRMLEIVTPRRGHVLQFWIPCTCRSRQGGGRGTTEGRR